MAKVAKAAGVPRESLYRAPSSTGNPRFSTLHAILRATGLKFAVESIQGVWLLPAQGIEFRPDVRRDYGEARFIRMRNCHEREAEVFRPYFH